ncbi:paramyosin-like [Impatiens glandulifera]|uniref:paramyosin-like n=1 Tax=Impatiens glandulifera TaxID=253017 RepID=UPI001FB055A7|nr:paramyosin-like [Impatiens glandulifera]
MESAEPPSDTRDEDDSASSSDRTASHNTEENESGKEKGPTEQEQSASIETDADDRGEENVPFDNDQKITENIVRRIMEEIDLRAQATAEVYSEWFGYRCNKFFKHMLPGLTDGQSFRRLKEIEEDVISLTNAKDPNEAMDRHAIAKLQLLVLDILEIKKGEFIDEIERLKAVRRQRDTAHSPCLETDDGQNPGDKSPLTDRAINETDDRTKPHLTDNLESDQVRDLEPAVTEEKNKSLIQEFVHTAVKPWKKKAKRVAVQAFKMAETARNDLGKANERLTEIEVNYRDDTVLYDAYLKRTEDLEGTTSKLVDDLERFQEKTEQRLTKVDEDLGQSSTEAASTLNGVISLEEKNASLEDRNTKLEVDLKAVTEQVNELMKAKLAADTAVEDANARAAKDIQDTLDKENRKNKEAPRSDANFEDRLRILTAQNPELAKSIAAREAKEAERLNAEKQRLEEYAKAHKKITEIVVEEDDFEEDLEPRPTRQRVSNAVPVSTVAQPLSPHQDTTGAGGSSSRPDQPVEDQPTDDLMAGFLPSELE